MQFVKTIVTKAQYAALKARQPGSVSNWIRDGKISARALVGPGCGAGIWVEQADLDLLLNLEPAQQDAQTHPIA